MGSLYDPPSDGRFFYQWPKSAIEEVNKLVKEKKIVFQEAIKIVSQTLVRN